MAPIVTTRLRRVMLKNIYRGKLVLVEDHTRSRSHGSAIWLKELATQLLDYPLDPNISDYGTLVS